MIFPYLFAAFITSLDNLCCGITFGIKNIKIPLKSLFIISFCQILLVLPIMLFSNFIKSFINIQNVNYATFFIFIILGINTLKDSLKKEKDSKNVFNHPELIDLDHNKSISVTESILLGLATGLDSAIISFSLGINNLNIPLTLLCFFITHLLLLGLGNSIYKISIIKKISNKLIFLPSIIFFILALTKLF